MPPSAAFEEHPKCELTDNRRRIVGPSSGGWSAATTVRLGGGDATVAFELVKKGRNACFGVLRPGADRDGWLGDQQGGVGLHTFGDFWVDGSEKRSDLPSISEGSRVVLEWRGGAQTLAWVVDGKRVLEHQGDFAGYHIAVGGSDYYDNTTIQLAKASSLSLPPLPPPPQAPPPKKTIPQEELVVSATEYISVMMVDSRGEACAFCFTCSGCKHEWSGMGSKRPQTLTCPRCHLTARTR